MSPSLLKISVFFSVVLLFLFIGLAGRVLLLSFCSLLVFLRWNSWARLPPVQLIERDSATEFIWKSSRGDYFSRIHFPKGAAVGVIFYFHGMNNYIDRTTTFKFAESATERGYIFALYDQRGYGKSCSSTTKILGLIDNWRYLIDDAYQFINFVILKHQLDDIPIFVIGMSMGGTVCLLLNELVKSNNKLYSNFRGAVLLAPAILSYLVPHWIIVKLLLLIDGLGGSWLRLGPPASTDGWKEMIPNTTRDSWKMRGPSCEVSQKELRETPWSSHPARMLIGTGQQLMLMTTYLKNNLKLVEYPFLCLHGTGDAIIPEKSSRFLMDNVSSTDKTLKIFDGVCHSIFDDPLFTTDIEPVIWKWIQNRT
eukprot:TRINITY_DN13455_c0_g1_i1.p1 TRINITY_DN13455_c0_g1~~TRINITY_DN13455_c0_g1_i1.p1  ORF type:complete len:385 (+),score=74.61 TRINITY_DN13455_c0_g1_i1:60-1157(+)